MVRTLEGFLELVEMRDNRFVWQAGDLTITTNPETLTKEEIKRGKQLLDRMEFQLKTGIKLKNECKTESSKLFKVGDKVTHAYCKYIYKIQSIGGGYATIIRCEGEQFGKLGCPISKLHKVETKSIQS